METFSALLPLCFQARRKCGVGFIHRVYAVGSSKCAPTPGFILGQVQWASSPAISPANISATLSNYTVWFVHVAPRFDILDSIS